VSCFFQYFFGEDAHLRLVFHNQYLSQSFWRIVGRLLAGHVPEVPEANDYASDEQYPGGSRKKVHPPPFLENGVSADRASPVFTRVVKK
jgi:hypothetical protein